MSNPELSLCIITRDEENNIAECLDSVKGVVNEIIVVDTGSKDKTISIANGFGAKLFHYSWNNDFAAAKNEALKHATGDWIIVLDADERVDTKNAEKIKHFIRNKDVDAYLVKLSSIVAKSGNTAKAKQITKSYRLFRNFKGFEFSGQIHEDISSSLAKNNARDMSSDIVIEHLGYAWDENALRKKQERNIKILKSQIKDNPENWYALYNIGQAYMLSEMFCEAKTFLLKAIKIPSVPSEHAAHMYVNIGECLFKENEFNEAINYCQKSLDMCPDQVAGNLILSRIYLALKNYTEAIKSLSRIIELQENDSIDETAVEINLDSALLHFHMGRCYFNIEKFKVALSFLKKTINLNSSYFKECIALIVQSHINLEEFDAALLETQTMAERGIDNSVASRFYYVIGSAWTKKRKYGKAINAYRLSQKLQPDSKTERLITLLEKHVQLNTELGNP